MKVLGLIVEYNPFHNGHIYHIEKAKELVQPDITVIVMSGNFVQRGEPAIIDKWQRTSLALDYGIDLVIELPFVYAVESADYFAKGAVTLLQAIGVTDIVFGSENGNIATFKEIAYGIKNNQQRYDQLVQEFMQKGLRYPDACNKALSELLNKTVVTPNDLLGLCYVKEVINNGYSIQLHCINRTNDFHSSHIQEISSASAIRKALKTNTNLQCLPDITRYTQPLAYLDKYFSILKYKILTSTATQLQSIHLVDEGLENLMLEKISLVTSMEEFITALTSKRYTRGRIQRMLIHVLLNISKEDILIARKIEYIRILGMNTNGRQYLHNIKKTCLLPIITNFNLQYIALDIEFRATKLYACLFENQNQIIESEYKNIPIIK